ncbi:GRAM domain containing 3, isoform CRA_a [Mus musculus]|nr:GRAM domain containing 3, isoform CRA_a [Mus musculus]
MCSSSRSPATRRPVLRPHTAPLTAQAPCFSAQLGPIAPAPTCPCWRPGSTAAWMRSARVPESWEPGAPNREPSAGVRPGRGPDDRAPARGGGRQASQSAHQERRQSWPGPLRG